MVEIKEFDKAYKNMLATQKVKGLSGQYRNRRIKELIAQGIDKEIATVMFDTGCVR